MQVANLRLMTKSTSSRETMKQAVRGIVSQHKWSRSTAKICASTSEAPQEPFLPASSSGAGTDEHEEA